MQLERDRREYRHAPILDLMTRESEEGRTVILGRDIDLTTKDYLAEAVMACLRNHWDRSALANVMKGIDPGVRRFLETFAIAYVTYPMAYPILHTTISDIILRMWDFTKWRPLPDGVEWERGSGSPPWLCRMKRFQAKPGHGRWVELEVDENGDVLDIPVNRVRKEWIEEGTVARVGKVLQRLKI
ncbi:hypothetical protein FRC17_010975 [Serendipita sp. 399]|nr:hypothetical protein FRC17_010975 [Serendipita sp. 399]